MSAKEDKLNELLELFGFDENDKPDYIDNALKNYSIGYSDTDTRIIYQVYRGGTKTLIACNNRLKHYKVIYNNQSTNQTNEKRLERFNLFMSENYPQVHGL